MKVLAVLTILALVGCATPKTMTPTGGSKADGIVNLSYSYTLFEQPQVDMEAARVSAVQRCEAWGYKNAEAFGGQTSECNARNGYGNCINTTVTVPFQCLDK